MKKIIIAAISDNRVLGVDGGLAWDMPADRDWLFSHIKDQFLIMGRRSYEEIDKDDYFPGTQHAVISRNESLKLRNAIHVHSLEEAVNIAEGSGWEKVYILGGGQVFTQEINSVDELIITEIKAAIDGDTYFPVIDPEIWREDSREQHLADSENPYDYHFVTYHRR